MENLISYGNLKSDTKFDDKILCYIIRKTVLRMIYQINAGHIGSSFSCVEILYVLYFYILTTKPKKLKWK